MGNFSFNISRLFQGDVERSIQINGFAKYCCHNNSNRSLWIEYIFNMAVRLQTKLQGDRPSLRSIGFGNIFIMCIRSSNSFPRLAKSNRGNKRKTKER